MTSATTVLEAPESTTAASIPASTSSLVVDGQLDTAHSDWTTPSPPKPMPPEDKEFQVPRYGAEPQIRDSSPVWSGRHVEGGFRNFQQQGELKPEITQEARQWLTGDLEVINKRVMLLCIEHARRMHVQIKSLRIFVKRSWEGEFNELALEVFVEANIPQSLALWDAIGGSIQRWGSKQRPICRRILNEDYAVFVEALKPV